MKKIFCSLVIVLSCSLTFSQSGVLIGSGNGTPDASAILELQTKTKGFLIPRMVMGARLNIASPATGLLVYQTDGDDGYYYYDGGKWRQLGAGDNLGNHTLTRNLNAGTNYISKYGTDLGFQMLDSGAVRIVADNRGAGYASGGVGERFVFGAGGGLLAKGILGVGYIPMEGQGERLMWHPYKAALRAGSIGLNGEQWNEGNIGFYSTAFGYNTLARGSWSFASGEECYAYGVHSIAMGFRCIAGTNGSIAMGYRCNALEPFTVALGYRASTGDYQGSMVFSDFSSNDSTVANADNRFFARFANGYRLYTNASKTNGVYLNAGNSSWSSLSDSTKKENYEAASGEDFLNKLAHLKLGSWNYKTQDPLNSRHYGPMAQEIFAAYGNDSYGVIGCDTLLATADMDGIMMIMLQGLEKRTSDQQATIAALQKENAMLRGQLAEMADLKSEVKRLIIETKNAMAMKE